jgi:hypothetical protein
MDSLPKDTITYIAITLFNSDNEPFIYKKNCHCTKFRKSILAFMYTCKRIYNIIKNHTYFWQSINPLYYNKIPPQEDLRCKFIKYYRILYRYNGEDISHLVNCIELTINSKFSSYIPNSIAAKLTYFCITSKTNNDILNVIDIMVNLKRLHICSDLEVSIKRFSKCTKLEVLKLCSCEFLHKWNLFGGMPNLRKLVIPLCTNFNNGKLLYLPNLEFIIVNNTMTISDFFGHKKIKRIIFIEDGRFNHHYGESPTVYYLNYIPSLICDGYLPINVLRRIPTIQMIQYNSEAWIANIKLKGNMVYVNDIKYKNKSCNCKVDSEDGIEHMGCPPIFESSDDEEILDN